MPAPRSRDRFHQKKHLSLNTEALVLSSCSKQSEGKGWTCVERAAGDTSTSGSHDAHLIEVIIIKEWDIVLQLPMHGVIHLVLPFLLQLGHTLMETQNLQLFIWRTALGRRNLSTFCISVSKRLLTPLYSQKNPQKPKLLWSFNVIRFLPAIVSPWHLAS